MGSEPVPDRDQPYDERVVVELVPVLRRVVGARIKDPDTLDDLVQETLARLMSSSSRVDPDKLHHYAAVTARHVVASYAERNDRARNRSHLFAEAGDVEPPAGQARPCPSSPPATGGSALNGPTGPPAAPEVAPERVAGASAPSAWSSQVRRASSRSCYSK